MTHHSPGARRARPRGVDRRPLRRHRLSESSTANLRWANNTLTTNGVMTTLTQLTVISVVDGAAGSSAGVLTRTATTTVAGRRAGGRSGRGGAGGRTGRRRPARCVGRRGGADWYERAGPDRDRRLRVTSPTQLGEALGRRAIASSVGCTATSSTTSRRPISGRRPACAAGTSSPPRTSASPASPTTCRRRPGSARRREQIDEFDVGGARRGARTPADRLGARTGSTCPPVATTPCCRPTAVADLMIYAYYVASAPGRLRRTDRLQRPGRWHPGRPAGRPARRPAAIRPGRCPAWRPRPSSSRARRRRPQSVFDNGLATSPDRLDRRRHAAPPRHVAAHRERRRASPSRRSIDNLTLEIASGAGIRRRPGRAAIERGLLLTCLWYIREVDPQTLLLTGLTRDGVYLVEGGEVVGAVNNFRFNESPVDLLNRFSDAGETVRSFSREWGDYFPRTATPAAPRPRLQHVECQPGAASDVGQSGSGSRPGSAPSGRTASG